MLGCDGSIGARGSGSGGPGGGGEAGAVGAQVMHRLNRTEYRNTVRDLLGTQLDPAANFPADDVSLGFDNIAQVLTTGLRDAIGSHHQGNSANHAALQAIDTWEVEQLAYLLQKMDEVTEGTGTLLQHSQVFFSSEIEDGDALSHHARVCA